MLYKIAKRHQKKTKKILSGWFELTAVPRLSFWRWWSKVGTGKIYFVTDLPKLKPLDLDAFFYLLSLEFKAYAKKRRKRKKKESPIESGGKRWYNRPVYAAWYITLEIKICGFREKHILISNLCMRGYLWGKI